ncbi:hypothetical protein [uncultured Kordia sp.]|uniref:hypothetical protein n=1 Tax=uncultured Kordia sp. TaxID=507699 RepID=UPI002628649D|nr:hypothetical protein [uncultured Kordia sp.]
MKYDTFLERLETIVYAEDVTSIPIEEYYRKLLFQVELNATEKVTAKLLLHIFKMSFTSEPIQFDNNWNNLVEIDFFVNYDDMSNEERLEFTKNLIRFFSADLRRLGEKVLKDPYRGLGISSSSGARWYNFDIAEVVSGWERFYKDSVSTAHETEENMEEENYFWTDIADILLTGKGYE